MDHEDQTSKILTYEDIKDYIKYEGNKVECTTFEIYKDKTVYLAECKVNNEEVEYTYGIKQQEPICKSTKREISIELGTKYECKVNNTQKYNFYVLSLNDDNTINLIMDRNICDNGKTNSEDNSCHYKWHIESGSTSNFNNTKGPDTAMSYLYEATKTWKNVLDINFTYNDKTENENFGNSWITGYSGINIENGVATIVGKDANTSLVLGNSRQPLKSRLPSLSEVVSAGCNKNPASCPVWLVENLQLRYAYLGCNTCQEKYDEIPNENTLGYWLLTSYSDSPSNFYCVWFYGNLNFNTSYGDDFRGIRPVITVPISYLE